MVPASRGRAKGAPGENSGLNIMDPLLVAAIAGVLRAVVTAGVGYAAAKGYLGGDQAGALVAALTTIGVAGWSVAQKAQTVPAAQAAQKAGLAQAK
jgi:hypothetical protein